MCRAAQNPSEGPRTVPGLELKLVWIHPGSFAMGSPETEPGRRPNEGPVTQVHLTRGFWLGAYEVTQGQWQQMMGRDLLAQARLAQKDDRQYLISAKKMMYLRDFAGVTRDGDPMKMIGKLDPTVPIYWVSWDEAVEFCRALNRREAAAGRLPAGFEYRLPSEAEWEYACRAGTTTASYAGDLEIAANQTAKTLDGIAWYTGNSGEGYTGHAIDSSAFSEKKIYSAGLAGPHTVGTKAPNPWGLYDTLGNAAEWCLDWNGNYPGGSVTDWTGPATGTYHVRRGGGWSSNATLTRAAYRNWHEPTYRWSNLGFRIALGPARPAVAASAAGSTIRDSLAVQAARNARMTERGKAAYYTDRFDLSDLPHYVPRARITGEIRLWGSNYFSDGNLARYWQEGFAQFHPGATFTYHLKSPTSAIPSLYTGVADIGVGKVTFESTLTFQRQFGYLPLKLTVVTGSLDVAGWHDAQCIFVHKDNPLAQLSISQLDGIFGSMRSGGWQGIEWHPEFARGPESDIRTWGQLGLAGEWATRPIHVYGLDPRNGAAIGFSNRVLKGSDKWSETLRMYANFARPDGSLAISATMLVQDVGRDPSAIGYGGIENLTPKTKVLAVAAEDGGPYIKPTLRSVQDRSYPLADEVYMVLNRPPGRRLDPKLDEYLRYVLSREGQEAVERDGKYLPLTGALVREQLQKLN